MGQLHKPHGRITVETRRDFGFIIHANYGVRIGRRPVGELKPGSLFHATDPETGEAYVFRLVSLFEDRAEARTDQFSSLRTFPLEQEVEVPGTEEFDPDDPLGETWNGRADGDGGHPHPEFKREDLDDLIDALTEARKETAT